MASVARAPVIFIIAIMKGMRFLFSLNLSTERRAKLIMSIDVLISGIMDICKRIEHINLEAFKYRSPVKISMTPSFAVSTHMIKVREI